MIRFGIVGFGLHAVKRLMPGFAQSENCTVTAISRLDPEKARQSADQFGIPLAFDAIAELCGSNQVDAVFVASPDALHLPDVLQAIEYGKPVLCEKPMAMNSEEARRMVTAARDAGVLLGVAQVFRFEQSTRRFRERITAGDIGCPLLARAEFCYEGLSHPRRWVNDPELACGGPIADVGVHCIDTLRFVLQDEAMKVSTLAFDDEASQPFECAAFLTLDFARGTLASIAVSTRTEYRTVLEIVGDEGTLTDYDGLNVERPLTIEYRRGTSSDVLDRQEVSNQLAYALQVDAFAAAIEKGGEFEIPGEEGLRNQLILDTAYLSMRTGCTESVPTD